MLFSSKPWLLVFLTALTLTEAGSSPSYSIPSREKEAHSALNKLKRQNNNFLVPCAPADAPKDPYVAKLDGESETCLPSPLEDLKSAQKRSFSGGLFQRWTTAPAAITITQPSSLHEPLDGNATIQKRADGVVAGLYNALPDNGKVLLNHANTVYWQRTTANVDMSAGIGVRGLCGGTVVIVASPFAIIMMHLQEQRSDNYQNSPKSSLQAAADDRLVLHAVSLVNLALQRLESNYPKEGWFPPFATTLAVIAPEYDLVEMQATSPPTLLPQVLLNLWKRESSPPLVYLFQTRKLISALTNIFGHPDHPGVRGVHDVQRLHYRIRQPGISPNTEVGDREYVVVTPFSHSTPEGETVSALLSFDDDKAIVLNPLAFVKP